MYYTYSQEGYLSYKLCYDLKMVNNLQSVWPEKISKCLQKLPKNDFTRKMIDFDTLTKIA